MAIKLKDRRRKKIVVKLIEEPDKRVRDFMSKVSFDIDYQKLNKNNPFIFIALIKHLLSNIT